jgi:hypothetical protein
MFYNNPNFIRLSEKVFVYPQFVQKNVSPTKVQEINDIMAKYNDEDFIVEDYHRIDWYKDKTGPLIPELIDVWDAAGELISPEYVIHPQLNLQVIRPGDGGMFIHTDSPGEGMEEELTQIDRWSTCCIISYGLVIYFGEFTGGETFYTKLDMEYAVKPGDLVIHGAHYDCEHGVREVTSGIRYAYSNFMMLREKNPGTFPCYGTEEDLLRKKQGLYESWLQPINI